MGKVDRLLQDGAYLLSDGEKVSLSSILRVMKDSVILDEPLSVGKSLFSLF